MGLHVPYGEKEADHHARKTAYVHGDGDPVVLMPIQDEPKWLRDQTEDPSENPPASRLFTRNVLIKTLRPRERSLVEEGEEPNGELNDEHETSESREKESVYWL